MNLRAQVCSIALSIFGFGMLASPSHAQQVIDWGAGAQDITGNGNVSTQGTLVAAYTLGPVCVSPTTVNCVTFNAFEIPDDFSTNTVTVGTFTFTECPNLLTSSLGAGNDSGAFACLSPEYQALLGSYASASNPPTITLTMNCLTVGNTYLFQWWSNNSADVEIDPVTIASHSGDLTNVALGFNPSNSNGGVGQFATGTFVATSTSFEIEFNGDEMNPIINAVQLRDVTAIPEPSTYAAILGAALLGFAVRRRQPSRV